MGGWIMTHDWSRRPFFPWPDAVIGNEEREDSGRVIPFAWPDRYWWGYC
jgi:hypothetical protein